ncbi:flagellin lysine-N-methylase [Clostridium celatum]|uniref:flagellin lysine-N-methylase n=1 Tax=Clostridium celatum TaxID=36834 RepID=UPI00319EAA7A
MKVNMFIPKYMADFKCIGSECVDTCCAGWDINIDENTFEKYVNSKGELKELVQGKFRENKENEDFLNKGFMILKEQNKCPFLNDDMLCDIHGRIGEENLCITCKRFPRVYNIIDGIYEKSGLPSCEEICIKAFLNKEKMEFIEIEEDIDESAIEIRRIIDTEAFEGTDSLLQYFWEIRVNSINIIQNRSFSIEERLNILKYFYREIEKNYKMLDFESIENILEDFSENTIDLELLKGKAYNESNEFYLSLIDERLIENIKGIRLKERILEYTNAIEGYDINKYSSELSKKLEKYSFIFENYLVNQIFKDLIPFNKGEDLTLSVDVLIDSYRIIKAYTIGLSLNSKMLLDEKIIIKVIQSLSKDIEHNKVFKNLLESKI